MNAKQFSEIIKDPNRIHDIEASDLKRMAHEYPYSQAVQFAYAFRLKNSGEHLFNQQLGRTSILTEDRSILYDFFEKGGIQEIREISKIPSSDSNLKPETLSSEKAQEPVQEENRTSEIATIESDQEKSIPKEESIEPTISAPPVAKVSSISPMKMEEKQRPKVEVEEPLPDLSNLSPAEKIKAILERSRKLQSDFEQKKSRDNEPNERIKAIRDHLEKIKSSAGSSDPIDQTKAKEVSKIQEEKAKEPAEVHDVDAISEIAKEPLIVREPTSEISDTIDEEIHSAINAQEEAIQKIENDTKEVLESETIVSENPIGIEEKPNEDFDILEAPVFVIEDMDAEKKEKSYESIKEDETHSFLDWFKRLPNHETALVSEKKEELKLEDKIELFDSFVNKLPELKKNRNVPAPKKTELVQESNAETGALVTETLAKVYISQGHFDKAKKAYQILKLKYPEKSSFFADRIQEIENLKNSK